MLKKILVFVIIIVLGFGAGYFSTPIYNFIWLTGGGSKVKLTDIKIDASPNAGSEKARQSEQYIPESRAINAVKGLPFIDLTKEEMKISGVGLAMTRREVEKAQGKKRKTKKLFDQALGQNVRIDNYDGLEITYDTKGRVIKVSTLKSDFAGPKGVKIGDTKERVLQLLGRGRTGSTSLLTYYPLDDENQLLAVRLKNNNIYELSLQNASNGN